jgi:hypothetical protein
MLRRLWMLTFTLVNIKFSCSDVHSLISWGCPWGSIVRLRTWYIFSQHILFGCHVLFSFYVVWSHIWGSFEWMGFNIHLKKISVVHSDGTNRSDLNSYVWPHSQVLQDTGQLCHNIESMLSWHDKGTLLIRSCYQQSIKSLLIRLVHVHV